MIALEPAISELFESNRLRPVAATGPAANSEMLTQLPGQSPDWRAAWRRFDQILRNHSNGDRAASAAVAGSYRLIGALAEQGWPPPVRITVGADGEIVFEWQAHGMYYEIEVDSRESAESMYVLEGQDPIFAHLDLSPVEKQQSNGAVEWSQFTLRKPVGADAA